MSEKSVGVGTDDSIVFEDELEMENLMDSPGSWYPCS